MNKLAVSIAVALALGLTACDDSLKEIKEEIGDNTVKPASRVVFDPGAATPRLSVPNDLLFQGTTDGTLTTDSGATPDYSNPQVALGALDGWSTQNPFTVQIDFPAGVGLNADSAALPGAVRVFDIISAGPTSADADCRPLTQGHACKIVDELVFGSDFASGAKGNSVAVIPLKPLKAATTYLLVLTSIVKDTTGESVAPSTSYELVKQDDESLPLSSASQVALQKLINSFEDAAESEGIDRESIIYTAAITTQSTDIVLNTVKQLIASSAASRPLMVQPLGYNAGQALVSAGLIQPADAVLTNPAYAAATTALVYGGTVSLPYYSPVPTDDNKLAPLTGRWLAKYDSPVTLLGAIQAGLLNPADLGLTPSDLQNPANLLGFDVPGLDDARHLTKFNPIPNETELDQVPVLMTVPDLAQINLLRGAQGLPPTTMPAGGWPVVIFQHGITGEKENALAIAGTLAYQGYAMVAIDHMLHGARGFEVEIPDGEGGTKTVVINATDNSATDYMNLQSLLTTRDNVRQSISDILALRVALNVSNLTQSGTINPTKVSFIGHSLGGITGTTAIAMANTPVQSTTLSAEQKAAIDALYGIDTATLAMPGGAIANFLLDSASFGPLIRASVILGSESLKPGFAGYIQTNGAACLPFADDAQRFAGCAAQFVDAYIGSLGDSTAANAIANTFAQFSFAAQTVIDSGDPSNYAQHMVASATPTYVIAVVGDGATNLPDQVIPNGYYNPLQALMAGKMPMAGTLPLARLLGAQRLNNAAGGYALDGANVLSSFSAGNHSSILSPAGGVAVTTEMQRQTASFIVSGGAAIQVVDPTVMAPAN